MFHSSKKIRPRSLTHASTRSYRVQEKSTSRSREVRLVFVKVVALLWVSLLAYRLYDLQIGGSERWSKWARSQQQGELKVASERGKIYDRTGEILAVSVPAGSVYVRPRQVKDMEATIRHLSQTLQLSEKEVRQRVLRNSPFIWIARQIPRVDAARAVSSEFPGVGSIEESRRYYPHNSSASTVIGRVGVDGNGLSGIEAAYEKVLNRGEAVRAISRDAKGHQIHFGGQDAYDFEVPKGDSVALTLDVAIQNILDEELERGRVDANAKQAFAVMVDADSGDILAMSQSPSPNFNRRSGFSKNILKNLPFESVFEPGSIMKPLVAAAAVDRGVVSPHTLINCEKGRYRVGRHTINDVHASDILTVRDVVVQSSNVGMTKIGQKLGRENLFQALSQFGFGQRIPLPLQGGSAGIFRSYERWAEIDVATHSFGQGIAVTPLQVVRAISSIVNGGYLPKLQLLSSTPSDEGEYILSERAAHAGREMMYGVVEDEHGTGKRARIEGVRVGGKTGTAQKARTDGRGYQKNAYVASFVGFADGKPLGVKQKLVLLVSIDEPNTTSIYGGTLAGPVFSRAMKKTLHLLTTRGQLRAPRSHSVGEKNGFVVPVGYSR